MLRSMLRLATMLVIIAFAFGSFGGAGVSGYDDRERMQFASACEFHRARSGPAGQDDQQNFMEFSAFLAKACAAALVSFDTGTATQRSHAALLLSRIVLLRDTIAAMNAARARTGGDRVSATGEFLIAHRMGLLIIYDAWLDTGVEVSLASYP
jgi:hypothetical protein